MSNPTNTVVETASGKIEGLHKNGVFRIPAVRLAEAQGKLGQNAYNYLFNWKSPALDGKLGSCHALELGFVFGTFEDKFSGSGPAAEQLAKDMQDVWIAFATNGDPSAGFECPTYGEKRETAIFGEKSCLEKAPYDAERQIWDSVPDTVIGSL